MNMQHVDDNAFTNASAIESLKHHKAAAILGETVDPRWVDISDNLVIHSKDSQNYKGYEAINQTSGRKFIGYPLNVITDKNRSKKIWNIMQKLIPKMGQRWPLECYLFYMPFRR
jgi:hypothetical protein